MSFAGKKKLLVPVESLPWVLSNLTLDIPFGCASLFSARKTARKIEQIKHDFNNSMMSFSVDVFLDVKLKVY